jgi:hypothetical protein
VSEPAWTSYRSKDHATASLLGNSCYDGFMDLTLPAIEVDNDSLGFDSVTVVSTMLLGEVIRDWPAYGGKRKEKHGFRGRSVITRQSADSEEVCNRNGWQIMEVVSLGSNG